MTIQRILFIELLGGIGDLVIALPAIHAVARSHPAAEMTVLTFAPGTELLSADPLIQQVVTAPAGKARESVEHLLDQAFDLVISDTTYDGIADLINHYQQKTEAIVIANLWRSPPDHERVSQRFIEILQTEGVIDAALNDRTDRSEVSLTIAERKAAQHQLGALYRPLVVLCPDTGMAIKQWPVQRFVELGKALQQRYGATILLPASPTAEAIAAAIGDQVQVWPRGSLRQVAAAIRAADLVIAVDTGLAHIAAALQVPTITLFGPTWAERYGQGAPHINLQGFAACSERIIANFTQQCCWYSGNCPYQWQTCLEDISVASVLTAADRFLISGLCNHGNHLDRSTVSDSSDRGNHLDRSVVNESVPCWAMPTLQNLESWRQVRNLLVMRLDNIGDVVMTSPALKALKDNLPQAKLTLMASPAGSLAAPLLPWVDAVLTERVLWQDLGKLEFNPDREWRFIETLRSHQFDAVVIFTSFSQSPHPAGLICALANIPLRLGESKEFDNHTLTHPVTAAPDWIHQVDRNLRLIQSVGFQVNDRRLQVQVPELIPDFISKAYSNSFIPASSYLLLNPWTSCPSRNYPAEKFAAAAAQLSDKLNWPIVVTGVAKDRDRAEPLLQQLGDRAIDLIGKTDLPQLTALVAKAGVILTNNTSVMHLADATQTPMVVLFAGTEYESQWHPRYTAHRLLRRSTVCSPCYAFDCAYQMQCLDLSAETVVQATLDLLQEVR